jgi:chemotaxis protein histidine kinase CheA
MSNEPALDMSEIMDMYKEDAKRMVGDMHKALRHWSDMAIDGPPRQELRRLSHQLRGSGRTYGFSNVTRISKALEQIIQKVEKKVIPIDERTRHAIVRKVERLAQIFSASEQH